MDKLPYPLESLRANRKPHFYSGAACRRDLVFEFRIAPDFPSLDTLRSRAIELFDRAEDEGRQVQRPATVCRFNEFLWSVARELRKARNG